jgi:hypothetical protein
MEHTDLSDALQVALRDLAIKAADLRAARARFDALVRLHELMTTPREEVAHG